MDDILKHIKRVEKSCGCEARLAEGKVEVLRLCGLHQIQPGEEIHVQEMLKKFMGE